MGLKVLKKTSLLFLIISASLLSTSFAGRQWNFVEKPSMEVKSTNEEKSRKTLNDKEAANNVHERLLRVNTKDYGTYDPSPALVKPPFKLIPN
ncbi:hypothetical protein HHK36_010185 [Tetracentron sinense]|uniref:Uncharacterized protein n=1 Tax=Tetracentron sinense TaxID=13715 RepID=A0A835DIX3_TETSI|nr:hypothetical protein HHK36_010185 [Tetracentron sinense]